MKSLPIKQKLMVFVLGMTILVLAFCIFLGIGNQSIFHKQNLLLTLQENYDTLKDGFASADSMLFTYAQSSNEPTRTSCLAQLSIMDELASALCQQMPDSVFYDLKMLTSSYTDAAREILSQVFANTDESLAAYALVSGRIATIQMLLPVYTKAMNTYRSNEKLQLEQERITLERITVVGASIMALVFAYVLLLFSDKITSNLTALTACAEQICQGNWSISMPAGATQSRDEVGVLTTAFYHMLETIRQQIEQLKKQKLLEQQVKEAEVREAQIKTSLAHAQLMTLQSRVNPHFLFNALNIIAGQAAEESAFKTLDMLAQTANYLRYSLSQLGKTVMLKDEVQNAEDYLAIQKRRFGNRLHYTVEVDPTCREALVPSMLLQPICENALIHGIMPKREGGHIRICVSRQEEIMQIAISDDGIGFQPEQLRLVRERLQDTSYCDTDGIGLSNVVQQASHFYGNSIRVFIDSKPMEGACIALLLPCRERKKKNEECPLGG